MILLLLLLISSCTSESSAPFRKELLKGREGIELYSIDVPPHWTRSPIEIKSDTKEPIAVFEGVDFKLVIHNFPSMQIPPQAQVARWEKQAPNGRVKPQSFSGYEGLLYQTDQMIAVALSQPLSSTKEMNAPVTLKATGAFNPLEVIEVIRSFETLEPIRS